MERKYNFEKLKDEIQVSAKEHNTYGSFDGVLYNGSTILAITFTSLASLLPSDTYILKIFSGMAAIILAIDRSVNWGARWIYHRQMRHEYLNVLAKITFFENLPPIFTEEESKSYFKEIFTDLYSIRRKETEMPGVKTQDKKVAG